MKIGHKNIRDVRRSAANTPVIYSCIINVRLSMLGITKVVVSSS